jgi:superfamily II DNA helicase RecQ
MTDSRQPCGICDFCNPGKVIAQRFRPPTKRESADTAAILTALKSNDGVAAGRLYAQSSAASYIDRGDFEELLNSMARGGLVAVSEASFEKDGKRIEFRKVNITEAGRQPDAASRALLAGPVVTAPLPRATQGKKPRKKRQRRAVPTTLEAALREWRMAEAKKSGIPPFRVLTDKALLEIAAARPETKADLSSITGVSSTLVRKYGEGIVRVVSSSA